MIKFKMSLLAILLTMPTKALAQGVSQVSGIPQETILLVGQPSPYTGVLIPELHYREYVQDKFDLTLVQGALDSCNNAHTLPTVEIPVAKPFLYGAASGIVATVAAIILISLHK